MREPVLCRHLTPMAPPDRLTATICETHRLTATLCEKASAGVGPHHKERRSGTARICEKISATSREKSQDCTAMRQRSHLVGRLHTRRLWLFLVCLYSFKPFRVVSTSV